MFKDIANSIAPFLSKLFNIAISQAWLFSTQMEVTALLTVTHEWFKVQECRQDVSSVFFDVKNRKHLIPSPINL